MPSYEESGTFDGLGLHGSFREWKDGDRDLRIEQLGIRGSTTLRIGDRIWVKDENGAVRELLGIAKRRQVTEDFLGSTAFTAHPEFSTYAGTSRLPDGRTIYELNVAPPGGEPYHVGIDASTGLIVQTSYFDADGRSTSTLSDVRVKDGMLVPYVEVDSNGDAAYDVTGRVTEVRIRPSIPAGTFAPLVADDVSAPQPVRVPYVEEEGLPIVPVQIDGKTYHFLLDSGSQSDVVDRSLVAALGLQPQGELEVAGAKRTSSGGVASVPGMSIGGVRLPTAVAAVLDLSSMLRRGRVDGILGNPLLAAADVRIDPDAHAITLASPGTLAPLGARLDVDTDRELTDVVVKIDREPARVLFDTGDANELLVFQDFIADYPGIMFATPGNDGRGTGIGGSVITRAFTVDDLSLGPYQLFNRQAVVVFARTGAFADRNDDGNVGYASLKNFIITFSLPDHAVYLQPANGFDNGRFRSVHR